MRVFDVDSFIEICNNIEKEQADQGNTYRQLFIAELKKLISQIPTFEAVPFEPLCEFLGNYAVPPVSECCITTEARTAAWKAFLIKCMEEAKCG